MSGSAEPGGATGGARYGTTSGDLGGVHAGGSRGSDDTLGGTRDFGGSTATMGGAWSSGGSAVTTGSVRASGGSVTSLGSRAGGAPATSGRGFQGGSASAGSPSGGTDTNRNLAGSPSQAGAIDPCSLPGAYCPQASLVWTECRQRGGACVTVSHGSDECPAGSYNPFAANTYCPTGFMGRCCVPEGDTGSPCDPSKACRTGACWPEAAHYPSGGVCGHICGADDCPSHGTCLAVGWSAAPNVCLVTCADSQFCRTGQSCQAFSRKFGGGEIAYGCWSPGSPTGKGLGESCDSDSQCLSYYCRPDSTGARRCSAPCDASTKCLRGYTCVTDPACSGTQCDFCFPT